MENYLPKYSRQRSRCAEIIMIRSLQSLRGIFAILIFLTHYKIGDKAILPAGGDCGVAFFIMLSGFVLSAGYAKSVTAGTFRLKPFLQKRLKKIYPLHLFCFVWAVILYRYFAVGTASSNLLLLQSWVPDRSYFFSYNAVSWFLSDVFFFYLLFPFLIARLVRSAGGTSVFAVITVGYIVALSFIPADYLTAISYISPATRLLDFVMGMLLWKVYNSRSVESLKTKLADCKLGFAVSSLLELFAVITLILFILGYSDIAECYSLAVYWWPVMALIILVFSFTDNRIGLIGRVLQWGGVMSFGSISLGFYLVHVLTIHSCHVLINKFEWHLPDLCEFMIVFFTATLLGILYNIVYRNIISRGDAK